MSTAIIDKWPVKCNVAPAMLSTDAHAVRIRDATDYSQRIDRDTASRGAQPRPVRIYCDGVFDLFHYGHAQLLFQAKNYFPGAVHVIAGVNAAVHCGPKRAPRMSDAERVLSVRHCRYVDEVYPESPFFPTLEFCTRNKIDFVLHDDAPYPWQGMPDMYAPLRAAGMFLASVRTAHISTTNVIERIEIEEDAEAREDHQQEEDHQTEEDHQKDKDQQQDEDQQQEVEEEQHSFTTSSTSSSSSEETTQSGGVEGEAEREGDSGLENRSCRVSDEDIKYQIEKGEERKKGRKKKSPHHYSTRHNQKT